MLTFKALRWKNFLATGNVFTEIKLDSDRLTLFSGESGNGKSTMLDALAFVCYNRAYRNINKTQVVNSINQKDCLVECEFTNGGHLYLIRRGIKPNVFEIYKDGNLVNQDSANMDYQQHLETQILKFNFKTFKQIVVLGASDFIPFMQLKASERRIIVEELLDLEVFSQMNGLLSARQKELREQISENTTQAHLIKEEIRLTENFVATLKADNKDKVAKKELEIGECSKQKQVFEEQLVAEREKLKELKAELTTVGEVQLPFDDAEIREKISQCEKAESKLEANIAQLRKHAKFYTDHDDCPTCGQVIETTFKANLLTESEASIADDETKLKKLEKLRKGWIEKQQVNEAKKKEHIKIVQQIEGKVRDQSYVVREVETKIKHQDDLISRASREIADLKKPKKSTEDEKKKLKALSQDLARNETEKETLARTGNLYSLAEQLLKDNGFKALIIRQYLPLINKFVNQFLQHMNFFVSFEIDEQFQEAIKSRGRDTFSYANFSEGEKQRIDLALLFAWRTIARMRNSVSTNLLVLDEVFDSYLNQEATENVIDMLRSDMLQGCNIFVISHKETISDKFDKVIKFAKHKNFSHTIQNV